MSQATTKHLDPLLKAVSRSVYLSLKAVPRSMRPALGVAYLFCRAADTIADTTLVPTEERLDALGRFREQFRTDTTSAAAIDGLGAGLAAPQKVPEERDLLERLDECFALYHELQSTDRELIQRLVTTLTQGMATDLEYFPPEESGDIRALETDDDLDLYTYHVAGCVGEFWTDLQIAHRPRLRSWDGERMRAEGARLGKGLQMTNILRDLPDDLKIGRCYLPRPRLEAVGVDVQSLRDGLPPPASKMLLRRYLEVTLAHYDAGWRYVLMLPRGEYRLRLACAWPLLIGLPTLEALARHPDPYGAPTRQKISRREVYRIVRRSAFRVFSNRSLSRYHGALRSRVEAAVSALPRWPE